MGLYLGLLFFYITCIIVEKILDGKLNGKIWISFLITPAFLLTAFRAPVVGNDTYNYFNSYLRVSQEPLFSESSSRLEVGYVALMRLFGSLNFEYIAFQIITVAFIYFSLGKFLLRYSNKLAMSMFVFLTLNMFFQTMNISRQYIAIAILTYSVSYILDKKPMKFAAIVLLAACFHQTALIFLIIYYITNTVLTRIKIFGLIIVGVIFSFGFDYLIKYTSIFFGGYETYLDGQYFNPESNVAIVLLLSIYFSFYLVGVYSSYGKESSTKNLSLNKLIEFKKNNKKEKMIYGAAIIIFIMAIIGLNTTIMSRLISYFLIFYLIYVPDVLHKIENKNLKIPVTLFALAGLCAHMITIMVFRPEWTGVIPYFWYFGNW